MMMLPPLPITLPFMAIAPEPATSLMSPAPVIEVVGAWVVTPLTVSGPLVIRVKAPPLLDAFKVRAEPVLATLTSPVPVVLRVNEAPFGSAVSKAVLEVPMLAVVSVVLRLMGLFIPVVVAKPVKIPVLMIDRAPPLVAFMSIDEPVLDWNQPVGECLPWLEVLETAVNNGAVLEVPTLPRTSSDSSPLPMILPPATVRLPVAVNSTALAPATLSTGALRTMLLTAPACPP